MKEISSNLDFNKTHEKLGKKINAHLVNLDRTKKDDKQKILELCQVGKLLATYFDDYEIIELREEPDFLISNGPKSIGLEHQMVIDFKSKQEEGFYENICEKVEQNLASDNSIPNSLVNLFLHNTLSFKVSDKSRLIRELTNIVKTFILSGELIQSEIIKSAHKMPHSGISVNANFGAYMQKNITNDHVLQAISRKEAKLKNYTNNIEGDQWLVLVIGGTGESSFEVNQLLDVSINSKFDKIYLYEDFANKLFELK
jgi:hypothetical protein